MFASNQSYEKNPEFIKENDEWVCEKACLYPLARLVKPFAIEAIF